MAIAPNTDCLRHHKQLVDYLTLPCGLSEYRCHFARPFLFCPSPATSLLPILCSSRDFGTILPFGSMRRWDKILTHLSCSFSSVFADSLSNSRLPTPSRDARRQRERERERAAGCRFRLELCPSGYHEISLSSAFIQSASSLSLFLSRSLSLLTRAFLRSQRLSFYFPIFFAFTAF